MSAPKSDGEHTSISPNEIRLTSEPSTRSVTALDDRWPSWPVYKYLAIARPHHYPKNILVIVGAALACIHEPVSVNAQLFWLAVAGIIATCLIASSNYILNEILDATSDGFHPLKDRRPLATGKISLATAYLEWLLFALMGLSLAAWIGPPFLLIAAIFQLMALAYNVPPIRLKDIPYVDVLCEAINSPLRLLLGWTIVLPSERPGLALLLAFWMAGALEMARKRLNELKFLENRQVAAAYRKSFAHYNRTRLLTIMAIFAISALVLGAVSAKDLLLSLRAKGSLSIPLVRTLSDEPNLDNADWIHS